METVPRLYLLLSKLRVLDALHPYVGLNVTFLTQKISK
jgi:hypothetical protein